MTAVNKQLVLRDAASLTVDESTDVFLNERGGGGFLVVKVGAITASAAATAYLVGVTDEGEVAYRTGDSVAVDEADANTTKAIAVDRFPRFFRVDVDVTVAGTWSAFELHADVGVT